MPHARWLLACAVIVVGAFALVAATITGRNPAGAPPGSSSPAHGSDRSASPSAAGSGASSTPGPTATTRPTAAPPRASGDQRLAYAAFLLRVNDDRAKVDGLNRTLASAVDAGDRDAARTAAVAILDFVDVERYWLRGHPPAECYAAAHGSASSMLDAYGSAAERFVDWTAAGGGLDGLAALGEAAEAARVAGDALTAFGTVLERTRCPA